MGKMPIPRYTLVPVGRGGVASKIKLSSAMSSGRKRWRYRLEYHGLAAAAKVVPLLPRTACLFLAQLFGTAASIFDRAGRKVALENLELALGNELSRSERHRVMRRS